MDATYELGYEKFEQDEREFRSRVARFGKKGRPA
jgi:hypothetical protein